MADDVVLPGRPPAVRVLRLVTVALLFITMGLAGGLSYSFTQDAELRRFAARYDAVVSLLEKTVQASVNARVEGATAAASILNLPPAGAGINVLSPQFMDFSKSQAGALQSSALSVIHIVRPHERAIYEANVRANVSVLLPLVQNQTFWNLRARRGIVDAVLKLNMDYTLASLAFVRADESALDTDDPFFAAVTQSGPVEIPVFANDANFTGRRVAMKRAIRSGGPASTGLQFLGGALVLGRVAVAATVVYSPVYWSSDPASPEKILTGFASIAFSWGQVLQATAQTACDLQVLLRWSTAAGETTDLGRFFNSDGTAILVDKFTFTVSSSGSKSIGWGDRREIPDDLKQFERSVEVKVADAVFILVISPTQHCLDGTLSNTPRNVLVGAISIVAFVTICGVVYDIMAARYLNAVIRQHFRQYEARLKAEAESAETKHRFITTVSHEIRTPLNAVAGSCALLAGTALDHEQWQLVQLMDSGLVVIVDDILNLKELANHTFKLRLAKADILREVLDPAWKMLIMQPKLRDRLETLTFERIVHEGTPAFVRLDATRVMQVVSNILQNALKFTPSGGQILFEVDRVDSALAAAGHGGQQPPAGSDMGGGGGGGGGGFLRFRVTDTGIGISPENMEAIFTPFSQVDSASDRKFEGAGLGLTIGRKIAEAGGGRLFCTSEGLGRGACFTLLVPLRASRDSVRAASVASSLASTFRLPTGARRASVAAADPRQTSLDGIRKRSTAAASNTESSGGEPAAEAPVAAKESLRPASLSQELKQWTDEPVEEEWNYKVLEASYSVATFGQAAEGGGALAAGNSGKLDVPWVTTGAVDLSVHSPRGGRARKEEVLRAAMMSAPDALIVVGGGGKDKQAPAPQAHIRVSRVSTPSAASLATPTFFGSAPQSRQFARLVSAAAGAAETAPAPAPALAPAQLLHAAAAPPHQRPEKDAGSSPPLGASIAAVSDGVLAPASLAVDGPSCAGKSVLVAEDDRTNGILLTRILRKFGFEKIELMVDGEKAFGAFRKAAESPSEQQFSLILMDINMPVCDGHEATRRIRAFEQERGLRRTPVVALSASCSPEEVRRCEISGMDGHIPKPLRMDALALLAAFMDQPEGDGYA